MLDALGGRAAAAPEQPLLFYRSERGQFRWWSSQRSVELLGGGPGEVGGVGEPALARWLGEVSARVEPRLAAELARSLGPPAGDRDLWIATRAEPGALDGAMVMILAGSAGAVLWEPGPTLRPELFAWARPTLLTGTAAEIDELLGGFLRLAPRLARRRWIRRRLRRLRAVVVTAGDAESVATALAGWTAPGGPRILPFPEGQW